MTFNFIDNTAESDGAAIYATDIERCTYAPSLNVSELTNSYTRSIFKLEEKFHFDGNIVTGENKEVPKVATAPSWLKVEPNVRGNTKHHV